MAGKKKKKPKPVLAEAPRIYEATLASGPSGAVLRGTEIDLATAISRRKTGGDVVVCGNDVKANARLAKQIEGALGPFLQATPHKNAGPHALPHCQPATRPPQGHTFYETDNPQRKSRKQP